MSEPRGSEKENGLQRSIRLREQRRERWRAEGERSIGRNLAMIGAIGWLIVIPTLIGVALGRWLDRTLDAGITWTAGLIFVGLVFGCALAWRRISEE